MTRARCGPPEATVPPYTHKVHGSEPEPWHARAAHGPSGGCCQPPRSWPTEARTDWVHWFGQTLTDAAIRPASCQATFRASVLSACSGSKTAHEKPSHSGVIPDQEGFRGAPCRIRTGDPLFTRQVLWPAELRGRRRPKPANRRRRASQKANTATALVKVSPERPFARNQRRVPRGTGAGKTETGYLVASIAASTAAVKSLGLVSSPLTYTVGVPLT